MGGADTITLSGDVDGTTALIAAGEGADLVTISGLSVGSTVRGGSGNDTIVFADNLDGISASIFGGSDNDSIRFDSVSGEAGAFDDYSKISIAGGLGADSIVFSSQGAIGSGTLLGTLTYSSFAESNLENMDSFQLKGTVLSGGNGVNMELGIDFADALTAVAVGEVSASVLLGDANFSGNITTNVVTLSGSYSVSSVTAVAGTVDTLTLKSGKGGSVLFTAKGGDDYIFVQGGTAGTADDSIISLGDLSGGALALAMNGTTALRVTFSGQVA
jgi:hypothetical protein